MHITETCEPVDDVPSIVPVGERNSHMIAVFVPSNLAQGQPQVTSGEKCDHWAWQDSSVFLCWRGFNC